MAVAIKQQRLNDMHIRWQIRKDLPEVLNIETRSFEFPWTEDDFVRCLRQRNCIAMVGEDEGGRVIAFMVYLLRDGFFELLNFAVHPDRCREGVATQMLQKLIAKLKLQGRTRILLRVRERNLTGQLFLRSMGFKAISVEREIYDETCEDAYLFEYRVEESKWPLLTS